MTPGAYYINKHYENNSRDLTSMSFDIEDTDMLFFSDPDNFDELVQENSNQLFLYEER